MHGHLQKKLHPILPRFAGFGDIKTSTCHIFRPFEFIFYMVGSCEFLSVKKISKNKIKIKKLHISLLCTSSEREERREKNSTGYILRPFEFNFSMVGSCVSLSVKKISNK